MSIGECIRQLAVLVGHYAVLLEPYGLPDDQVFPQDLTEMLIRLQAEWADALNRADGGKRHSFASFAEWVARLNDLEGREGLGGRVP